jgi:hypothetical protein
MESDISDASGTISGATEKLGLATRLKALTERDPEASYERRYWNVREQVKVGVVHPTGSQVVPASKLYYSVY